MNEVFVTGGPDIFTVQGWIGTLIVRQYDVNWLESHEKGWRICYAGLLEKNDPKALFNRPWISEPVHGTRGETEWSSAAEAVEVARIWLVEKEAIKRLGG